MGDVGRVTIAQEPSVVAIGGGVVTGPTTAPARAAPNPRVTKVVVAVHGVGDQYSYATIQSVVNQFCTFYQQPAAIPLGQFHTGQVAFSIHPPYPPEPFERLAFAEVYWAKIPRAVVDDKHTIEESKRWAGTLVERVRLRWKHRGSKGKYRDADFDVIKLVLAEMIQTLAVLERLSFLATRAGLFTFDLRQLLEDYVGDVQIVAEFGTQRREILDAFHAVMTKVHTDYPQAELFLVAHSEGTVISFLSLLEAGRDRQAPGWIDQVRGFMTLGSPIDKHLMLWPELFPTAPPAWTPTQKIEWRNYYDRGDPIGFELDDARGWLAARQWDRVFNFTEADDFGFVRYPFPGKAHVDYWTDPAVFGHFIETVVKEPTPGLKGRRGMDFRKPPGDIRWKKWLSYVLPYVGVAALLFVAAFVLYKAVIGAIAPNDAASANTRVILQSVAGTTLLLLGITVATRIPRLTRSGIWHAIGIGLGVMSGLASLWVAHSGQPVTVLGVSVPIGGMTNVIFAFVLALLVYWITKLRPAWGLKPLIFLGAALVAVKVGHHLYEANSASSLGPVWPVFLATAAFLYLWWLAALIFDLVFVWHLHIRQARLLELMSEIMGRPSGEPGHPLS